MLQCARRWVFMATQASTTLAATAASAGGSSAAGAAAASATALTPTYRAHRSLCDTCYVGRYAAYREKLDFSYHCNYTEARQLVQDALIDRILARGQSTVSPWVMYTAGAMGAGKSYTLKWLHERGYFPLDTFVCIDPDDIKCDLPEMSEFVKRDPAAAGSLVHRESGYIAEIAEAAALDKGFNLVVDGSLRDHEWYRGVFHRIRERHPHYRLAIMHAICGPEKVHERAARRSEKTGRVIPQHVLDNAILSVPRSVQLLAPYADLVMEINTETEEPTPLSMRWEAFQAAFETPCSSPNSAGVCLLRPHKRASSTDSRGGVGDCEEGDTADKGASSQPADELPAAKSARTASLTSPHAAVPQDASSS